MLGNAKHLSLGLCWSSGCIDTDDAALSTVLGEPDIHPACVEPVTVQTTM